MSQNRRNPNDRQTWARENSDLIVIVVLLMALMVFKFRFAIAEWVHTENTETTENSIQTAIINSKSAVSCSSPSSGTDRSTPGGSFYCFTQRTQRSQRENLQTRLTGFAGFNSIHKRDACATSKNASSSLHGVLFSPLLTTDDRSIPTCSGPSADRWEKNNPAQRESIQGFTQRTQRSQRENLQTRLTGFTGLCPDGTGR
jgi:hypothetical protein